MRPTRPLLRYHGGKWMLAPWIISHFPTHRCYVEPYGGGASVLLRKKRSYAEVYNDLDGEVVNVFRVMRDHGQDLREKLQLTPFARAEYELAYAPDADPIEQARRTIIRAFMGFGSAAVTEARHTSKRFNKPSTGFRANSNRSGTTPAHDWKNYADLADVLIDRLRGLVIENRPALETMAQHDTPATLHYVDPPYLKATRDTGHDYAFEMTDAEHVELLQFLKTLKGHVVVSGYDAPIYHDILAGWTVREREALADGAAKRREFLWLSPGIKPAAVQASFF